MSRSSSDTLCTLHSKLSAWSWPYVATRPKLIALAVTLLIGIALSVLFRGVQQSTGVQSPSSHTVLYVSSQSARYEVTSQSAHCPGWFEEYAAFHQKHRGAPGTKYLVHLVDGISGGLGDRLNGAISMLRFATALNRVVLLQWAKPYSIEEFFEPAGRVNWSMKGIPYQRSTVLSFIDSWSDPKLHDGSLNDLADPFLTIITNMPLNGTCWHCPPVPSVWSKEASCLWQSLFRPVDPIIQQARAEMARLYPRGPHPYVAVHLRLGGLTGEQEVRVRGRSPLDDFIAGARCASQLAAENSIDLTQTPTLYVTDNHFLRQALQGKYFGQMVAPIGAPVHLDRAAGQSLEAHRSTVVDMVMMAWSTCLVTSVSGYSLHTWLYGGATPCTIPLTTCL